MLWKKAGLVQFMRYNAVNSSMNLVIEPNYQPIMRGGECEYILLQRTQQPFILENPFLVRNKRKTIAESAWSKIQDSELNSCA